jgi:hypothetical protein
VSIMEKKTFCVHLGGRNAMRSYYTTRRMTAVAVGREALRINRAFRVVYVRVVKPGQW